MCAIVPLALITGVLAQVSSPTPRAHSPAEENRASEAPGEPAVRLEIMRRSLAIYNIHPGDNRTARYRLQPEPIFRFTNPVGQSRDGAIFFWLDDRDRPGVAIQVFVIRNGTWLQEFTSLSPTPLIAESARAPAWTPSRGGVDLKPVPGAPRPAEAPEPRLRQMRALAQGFAAEDNFQNQSWQRLRLLSRPLARYGKPGTDLVDGALFCFALGTDPEVYLMLEARAGKAGPEWQFAFAPMSTYALRGTWQGKEVWSVPYRRGPDRGPNEPFHVRQFEPE